MPKFVAGDQIHFFEEGPRKIAELSVEEMADESYNWLYYLEPGDEIFGKIREKRIVKSVTLVQEGTVDGKYIGAIYHVYLRR